MIKKSFVILEIDYDDDFASDPEEWDWHELLEIYRDGEEIWWNVFPSENAMFQALYEKGLKKEL